MSKSFISTFIGLLLWATVAAAQTDHPLTGIADSKTDFEIAGDLASPEHWFDPDKLRQAALGARPVYLAALEQIRKPESEIHQLGFVTKTELLP